MNARKAESRLLGPSNFHLYGAFEPKAIEMKGWYQPPDLHRSPTRL